MLDSDTKPLASRTALWLRRSAAPTNVAGAGSRARIGVWARLFRVHQYAKNALVLVPLLTSHRFDLGSILHAVVAAVAFSVCASAVYIINDFADIDADRKHPTKCERPLASGAIRQLDASVAIPILLALATGLAAAVSLSFLAILVAYLLLSTAYTFALKKQIIMDVVVLALLYAIRVLAGAAAIDVVISEWLLAFSLFVFFALALVKRYTELVARQDAGLLEDLSGRDYAFSDVSIVGMLAASSALNAVTIFILYISSDAVRQLYARPQVLWLISPILMYWLSRILVLAHRRQLHDDPVVFALTDSTSQVSFLAILAILFFAI